MISFLRKIELQHKLGLRWRIKSPVLYASLPRDRATADAGVLLLPSDLASSPWPMDIFALGNISMVEWNTLILHPRRLEVLLEEVHRFQIYATNATDLIWFPSKLSGSWETI